MNINITDYTSVRDRARKLGCIEPDGLIILPLNFETADTRSEFRQRSEAATVRTLFRNEGLPLNELMAASERLPSVQNNGYEWMAPALYISSSLMSENSDCISLALSVLANYVTDFFRGVSGTKEISLDIIVEKTDKKSCKKISYKGDLSGLNSLPDIIERVSHE